ncbi:competence protein ComEC [Modestobacter sp. DSM 44400]|nr:competence protein ComEC [Modestobacter sp. DSM 44400]
MTTDRWSWVDLRLVPPAVTVWLLTLVARTWAPATLGVLAVGCAVLATVLLVRGRRPGLARWPARAAVAVACLAAATAVSATAAARAADRAGSPLAQLAAEEAIAPVLVRVDDDPRPLSGMGKPRVLIAATVEEAAGLPVRGGAVLVFGPAAEWSGLLPGQQVRLRAAVRPAEPGDDVVAVLSARSPPVGAGGPGRVQQVAGVLRTGLADSAARALDPRPAGLLPGLVVGDTGAMDPALTSEFHRAGLSHLTAVSGANVAIAVALVLWPLRRRAVDRRVQAAVGLLALVAFVVLARPGASVLRAGAMGAVTLVALASGRSRAAVPALSAAVAVLLLLDPTLARDGGFVLSVAATVAIVLLAPPWALALRRRGVPRLPAEAIAVSAAAGLVTAPLVAAFSGVVSLVSLPANLLAAPAVAPATVLGLGAAVMSPILPGAADVLSWLAGWPVRWLVVVAERAAAVPDGAAGWPAGLRGAVLLAVLLAGGAVVLLRWPRLRPLFLAALLGVVLLGWPLRQAARGWPPADTVLVACDVGQGDALVLPTAPGEGVLVDAGPDATGVDSCLTRLGVDRLPLVLLSHLDADHVAGLAGALTGRKVGVVATGTLAPTDDRVGSLERLVVRSGGRHVVLEPGEIRTVGDARFEVLAPRAAAATAGAEPNDLSMVVRASQRGVRVLLTGDLGAEAEQRLVSAGVDLQADVLKVPHHGSADADPGFLAASGAQVAVVSVGVDNTYGHPTDRLLDWLAEDRMRVYRTDRDGDVAVVGRAGDWGVAVRGPDTVARATAGGLPVAGVPVDLRRAARCAATGRSVPRDTMGPWQQHPRHRRRTCGWWWARRSCCVPARSPPSGRRSATPIPTPRSTSSSPAACRWAPWPRR